MDNGTDVLPPVILCLEGDCPLTLSGVGSSLSTRSDHTHSVFWFCSMVSKPSLKPQFEDVFDKTKKRLVKKRTLKLVALNNLTEIFKESH